MQANGNKKQISPKKYQVGTSAYLQNFYKRSHPAKQQPILNFRAFSCLFVVKKIVVSPAHAMKWRLIDEEKTGT